MRPHRFLLGVTGGVAAYKACLLARLLLRDGHLVRVLLTRSAARFVGAPTFHALTGNRVYDDLWDPSASASGEPHVELSAWADACVVYPATADLVARVAAGRSDDLLAATLLCLDKPVVLCPAMHSRMFRNPFFTAALERVRAGGVRVLEPDVGPLASGEVGEGRLPEPEAAAEALYTAVTPQDLDGLRLLVTAGPTREHLDPVRFLSNPSTGRMGTAVARVALRRGARVTLITGPVESPAPRGVALVRVRSAADMGAAVDAAFEECDALVMSAAVADFAPPTEAPSKFKKTGAPVSVLLQPTRDILRSLGPRKGRRLLVGFAMETEDLEARALAKLRAKDLDLVVANDLTAAGAGFGGDTNVVTLLGPDGVPERLPLLSKEDVASRILDRLADLRAPRTTPPRDEGN